MMFLRSHLFKELIYYKKESLTSYIILKNIHLILIFLLSKTLYDVKLVILSNCEKIIEKYTTIWIYTVT